MGLGSGINRRHTVIALIFRMFQFGDVVVDSYAGLRGGGLISPLDQIRINLA